MTQHISWTQECDSCKGTGLYVGMGEKMGAAIICHRCKGTGEQKMEFNFQPFTGRKPHPKATYVYATNPGIGLHPQVTPGGCPVAVWEKDGQAPYEIGRELREHVCPAWWYDRVSIQGMEPDWEECQAVGMFSQCKHFPEKAQCWARFDKEHNYGQKKGILDG